ncbi:MAG: hypothetical protein ACI9U6_002426 [Loktanella salsilacus]
MTIIYRVHGFPERVFLAFWRKIMSFGNLIQGAVILFLNIAVSSAAWAENLIYNPTNPGLGGNPNNYDYLIGLADLQNQYLPEQSGSGGAAPAFNFPPIVIDLGGVDSAVDQPAPDTGQ